MSVLYHLTIPRPRTPSLDAVIQEVEALETLSRGEKVYVNPARRPGSLFPERLYGLHRLPHLRQREASVRLHHVFNSHLFFFPYLRWLRHPIIYSVTAGLRPFKTGGNLRQLERLGAIVVSNTRDQTTLRSWGLENVSVIHPGIDTKRFGPTPPPSSAEFTLLAGSAPWTKAQFQSKGVEALLSAAEARPDLRLIFLWRGLLFDEMQTQVAQRGLQDRVQVLNHRVDVNALLSRVHAAVVLANDSTLVKAYPHSLLEALVAGRPVLVSAALPMADYVARTGCGQVVEAVSSEAILEALSQLEANYEPSCTAALRWGHRDFSLDALVEAYQQLYAEHT